MSTIIDEKVVSMRFDNKQFESNVQTSLSTLDKLKRSLNLTGATKGLEEVSTATKSIDMSRLSSAIDTIQSRFSAMGIIGVTALTNIANSAINTGKRMLSALTIDPIKTGFQEYETQINAVQTILANTSHAGTNLQDVNKVLDELNEYADKTIYNFTQMTRNIGTFTAAGVDLETSASAIQGIANLAAVSGSTSQQASNAMYQLSQAIANGKVNLQDWNSVVNAGMGGKVFQDALVKTAAAMQGVTEETFRANNITGSFRESINSQDGTGWLTSDILVKTLSQFTMAAEEGTEQWEAYKKSLMTEGYTEKQAEEIIKMANTATDAATKVKTFTQLWDTLKESAQSGWTQSWEIMIGDFEEAKEFLTQISDTVGGMINDSATSRNELLTGAFSSGWKQLLGSGIADEEAFIDTIKSVSKKHGVNFDKMSKDNESFEKTLVRGLKNGKINADILAESVSKLTKKMSKMTAEQLEEAGYTKEQVTQMKELNKALSNGTISMDEFVSKMMKSSGRQNVIDALWNAFDGLLSVLKPVKEAFSDIFPAVTSDQLYELTENLKKFTEGLTISSETSDKLRRTFKGLFSIVDLLRKGLTAIGDSALDLARSDGVKAFSTFVLDTAAAIGDVFTSLNEDFKMDGFIGVLSSLTSGISGLLSASVNGLQGFTDVLSAIGGTLVDVVGKIWTPIENLIKWIFENISAGDVAAGLAGGGIFMALKEFTKFLETIEKTFDKVFNKKGMSEWKEVFVETMNAVHDALQAFTTGLKTWSIVGIAVAITLLSSSLKTISEIKVEDVAKSITAIGIMMGLLVGSLRLMSKKLIDLKPKGFLTSAMSMIAMAEAVNILADAMSQISELTMVKISKGLYGIGFLLLELSIAMRLISKVGDVSVYNSLAMLALATSCKIIADALSVFANLSMDEINRGIIAMGAALTELVLVLKIMNSFEKGYNSIFGSVALLVAVQSLSTLADGLKKFGKLSWDVIIRGLVSMGLALLEVGVVTGLTGKLAGFDSIFGAAGILITVQGLSDLADALKKFGLDVDDVDKGVTGLVNMFLSLTMVAAAAGVLGKSAGYKSLLGAGAILVVIQGLEDLANALKNFGLDVDDVDKGVTGLVNMFLSLTMVAAAAGVLGKTAGFKSLLGAGAILLAIQGLEDLYNAFKNFGSMSEDEILNGTAAMLMALGELSLAVGLLGGLTHVFGLLGSASLLLAIQGLDDLYNAFKNFASMSWDEINQGLAAMGGALTEVAIGGILNTFSGIGVKNMAAAVEPLAGLAESMKKWKGITIPDKLGQNLGSLANAIMNFTFSGVGAKALTTAAPGIGVMADSIKKWKGVTIPEGLAKNISSLRKALSGFWTKSWSAKVIATAAPAIGTMADSIKKWKGVTVPETIGDQMKSIAKGIKSFTFAFTGGWSLNAITGPLGDLADSVSKWDGVTIPEGIGDGLTDLAKGVKAFSWAFMAGISIDILTGPLADLATDVKAWDGITIPEGIGDGLKDLAAGVKAFSWAFAAGISIDILTGPLADLAEDVKAWDGVTIPEGIGDGLKDLAKGVNAFSFSFVAGWSMDNIIGPLGDLADSVSEWDGVTIPDGIGDSLKSLAKGVNAFSFSFVAGWSMENLIGPLGDLADDVSKWASISVPENIETNLKSLAKGVNAFSFSFVAGWSMENLIGPLGDLADNVSKWEDISIPDGTATSLSSLATSIAELEDLNYETISSGLTTLSTDFGNLGSDIVDSIVGGISDNSSDVSDELSDAVDAALTAITTEEISMAFYNAGSFLVSGFVNGIDDNTWRAAAIAAVMAAAAVEAAEEELDINSPSKVGYGIGNFFGMGFINALGDNVSKAYDASSGVAKSAISGVSDAISKTKDLFDLDVDSQPTIRPVLDISDVESGVGTISNMLNMHPSMGVLANINSIGTTMNRRSQNGTNGDVVAAIKSLDKTMRDKTGDTYAIGDVSYSEGSDVSNAIKQLAGAIARERRV